MVWFWLNHFNVFRYKGDLRWLITDYEEQAIRPHALRHFRDLVMATLEHPAMLQYLDNSPNAAGHINEDYRASSWSCTRSASTATTPSRTYSSSPAYLPASASMPTRRRT